MRPLTLDEKITIKGALKRFDQTPMARLITTEDFIFKWRRCYSRPMARYFKVRTHYHRQRGNEPCKR